MFNANFLNKPKLRPVIVKDVQKQHQIDLVNLSNMRITLNGKTYRYILSLMDVFSRYHWLRPLETKHPSRIAYYLKKIYNENGPPSILQSDRGSEFKKEVKQLCSKYKITMVQSRPYHPETQGKWKDPTENCESEIEASWS